jgi:hypothetical protein
LVISKIGGVYSFVVGNMRHFRCMRHCRSDDQ